MRGLLAIWANGMGVLQIVVAIALRREITGEWRLTLDGLASIVFGVILVAQSAAGALAVLMLSASYAVIFWVVRVILAFKARNFAHRRAG